MCPQHSGGNKSSATNGENDIGLKSVLHDARGSVLADLVNRIVGDVVLLDGHVWFGSSKEGYSVWRCVLLCVLSLLCELLSILEQYLAAGMTRWDEFDAN